LTTYTASKGAVLTLTKAIALDFGAQGIRANTVCPGFVDTPLNVPHYEALGALEAGLPDFQPIGRAIEPIEIAHSVAFLLSDHSTAIPGTAFVVDGGVLAGA
jgi:meso-butanediol dehydrogenase/(S,S)-butanediol dehydrogenase/diacetyl reductase